MKEVLYMVNVIGAGLAGCEAAYYLARNEIKVKLYEMRPLKMTPAHKTEKFGELVCSNSLKSEDITTASGVLKQELLTLNCKLLEVAYDVRVPAGQALAIDRERFSEIITDKIKNHKNIYFYTFNIVPLLSTNCKCLS